MHQEFIPIRAIADLAQHMSTGFNLVRRGAGRGRGDMHLEESPRRRLNLDQRLQSCCRRRLVNPDRGRRTRCWSPEEEAAATRFNENSVVTTTRTSCIEI